jgi:hypothetical protein
MEGIFILPVILALGLWSLIALIIIMNLLRSARTLRSKLIGARVRRGFLAEQWLPLVKPYPWDPSNFRFLGDPIDGIQFEDEEIILVEFKTGESKLSKKQIQIRELLAQGKMSFKEVRVKIKNGDFEDIQIR